MKARFLLALPFYTVEFIFGGLAILFSEIAHAIEGVKR